MSRYVFVGSTIDLQASSNAPVVNRWCELSSIRLYDKAGNNVAPLVNKISWVQKPDGNQDLNQLVNTNCWPRQDFVVWDSDGGNHFHNGCRLVEFQFTADIDIVRATCLSTNCESFGTNPRLEKWDGQKFVTHLHTASGGGLSIMYLASNSPIGGFPGQIPSVGRDGTEAAMNESERNPEIGVGDDRTYTGKDGSVWLWNPSILKYERGVGGVAQMAQMAQMAAPPIFNMVSNFQMEEKHNFIEGANYSQINLNGEDKNRPLNWILQFGARMCDEKDAQGFFYQQHTNGHEIIGFYVTKRDMKGKKVWHGHSRGFIATRADVGGGEAEIILPAIAVSVGAMTIGGGGGDLPAFCVHDGLRLIGNFCAGCGAKRTDMLAGAGGAMAVVKPIDDFNGFVNTLLFRPPIILKSFNYPKHCWATTGPEEVRIESKCRDEYVPVPGLTGEPNTISFRSKYGEDTFLRHCGYWLRSHKNNGSDLFKKDATFFVRKGLVGVDEGYISFESTNFRGQYICHRSYKLRIDHSSDSDLHRKDASFKVE